MKKINAFKTSDKKVFEFRQEAVDHQNDLNLQEACKKIMEHLADVSSLIVDKDIQEELALVMAKNTSMILKLIGDAKTK